MTSSLNASLFCHILHVSKQWYHLYASIICRGCILSSNNTHFERYAKRCTKRSRDAVPRLDHVTQCRLDHVTQCRLDHVTQCRLDHVIYSDCRRGDACRALMKWAFRFEMNAARTDAVYAGIYAVYAGINASQCIPGFSLLWCMLGWTLDSLIL